MGLTTAEFLDSTSEGIEDQYAFTPQEIESLMFKTKYDYPAETNMEKYQPVLYEVIKDPA